MSLLFGRLVFLKRWPDAGSLLNFEHSQLAKLLQSWVEVIYAGCLIAKEVDRFERKA